MKKTRKLTKEKKLSRNIGVYFILLYTLLTVSLIAQIFIINIIPIKFIVPIIVLLVLIWIGLYVLQFGKKVNSLNKILGRLLIVILSILLIVVNWNLFKTSSTFSKVSGDNSKTSVVSVIVLESNKAEKLEDLKDKKFGISRTGDNTSIDKALVDIESDIKQDVNPIDYKSYKDFGDDLYDKKIDVIIIDEGTRGLFEDNHPNFSKETRVIKSYDYKTDSKDISKSVKVTEESFNIYITGIDTYGGISTVSRSDVNMIVTINPSTHQILLTSIPRDYYIPQPCQNNQTDKLTHSGMFGVECTIGSVENYFGIGLNYYARVNFSSVVDIVDAIGGIVVNNPTAFKAFDNSIFEAGDISLNGAKALSFARERESLAGGDRDRGKNQMRVITGIINKVISPTIITNYGTIMDAVGGSFQTNMTNNEMTSLIKMQLNDMKGWDIHQITVNGTGNPSAFSPANGFNSWVMEPDKKSVDDAVNIIKKVQAGEDVTALVQSVNATN